MKWDSRAFILARTFASPCLGHEPNAEVTTCISYKIGYSNTGSTSIIIYSTIFKHVDVINLTGQSNQIDVWLAMVPIETILVLWQTSNPPLHKIFYNGNRNKLTFLDIWLVLQVS
jgi:hypothetical protein